MKLNKNGVAFGIICLVVGSLLGNQVPSILQSSREEDPDYNFLYNKILTIEDDIEILYSNLPKEQLSDNLIISEKGILGGNLPFVWDLDLEEDTKININFKFYCHNFSNFPDNIEPVINYKLVKWNSSRYSSYWEIINNEIVIKAIPMFSSEDWLEVLPAYDQSFKIKSKNYSKKYNLTKGNWILYIEGYQQLMIYEITITQG
jgi:hypothetical protein